MYRCTDVPIGTVPSTGIAQNNSHVPMYRYRPKQFTCTDVPVSPKAIHMYRCTGIAQIIFMYRAHHWSQVRYGGKRNFCSREVDHRYRRLVGMSDSYVLLTRRTWVNDMRRKHERSSKAE